MSDGKAKQAKDIPSDLQVLVLLSFFVGLAIAICWVFTEVESLSNDPVRLMVFAVLVCGAIVVGIRQFVRHCVWLTRGQSLVLVFLLFSMFTASIDLCISSSLLRWSQLGEFYLIRGEEYFSAPAGTMCLIWDATAHLVLQAIVIRELLQQRPYGKILLVWAGSVTASMPPLLIGAATGAFASRIHASTALNIPWIFVPIAIGVHAFNSLEVSAPAKSANKKRSACSWMFLVVQAAVIVVYTLRMLIALRSPILPALWWKGVEPALVSEPSGFLPVQALMGFFIFVPWHAIRFLDNVVGVDTDVSGWEMAFVGAELQHAALLLFSSFILPPATVALGFFLLANSIVVLGALPSRTNLLDDKPKNY